MRRLAIGLGWILYILLANGGHSFAQSDSSEVTVPSGKKKFLKDTLDGKFDFSSFLIDANGFIPVLFIVTEPALGGFGGALAPLFLSPKKETTGSKTYVPPDITAGVGMYTANGSWAAGAGRFGTIPKIKLKYRVFAAYLNANVSFYRAIPGLGEQAFAFNIQAIPAMLQLSRQLSSNGIYGGLSYLYINTTVTPRFGQDLPEFIRPKELKNNTSTVGGFLDWDKRNTIFTPDKGFRTNLAYDIDAGWTGSDFDFSKLKFFGDWFVPVKPNWISGLHVEGQWAFNDPPFYLLPSVALRGIPLARYQAQSVYVMETEQRVDLNRRWSVLGFAGVGHLVNNNKASTQNKTVYNVGTGFRYLVARLFKLRAGIDVAAGPGSWGWYIVFGHNWNR